MVPASKNDAPSLLSEYFFSLQHRFGQPQAHEEQLGHKLVLVKYALSQMNTSQELQRLFPRYNRAVRLGPYAEGRSASVERVFSVADELLSIRRVY